MVLPKRIVFTQDGYEDLLKEQERLEQQRPAAVDELKRARDLGDLSENGAYRAARSKLSSIDSRLRRLKKIQDQAIINTQPFTGRVDIGCSVSIGNNNQSQTYHIVGSFESNLSQNKISCFSPVGKTLMGKRKGQTVRILTPSGVKEYLIEDVRSSKQT